MRGLVLALTLMLAACGGGGGDEGHGGDAAHGEDAGEGHDAQGTVTIAGQEATNHGSVDVAGAGEFELELDDFYFGPTVLEGEAGQPLTITMHNEGEAPHTFTIEEQGIDQELQPGDEGVSVDVKFPEEGALPFVCTFHRAQGMLGALSVDGSLDAGSGGGHEGHSDAPAYPDYG